MMKWHEQLALIVFYETDNTTLNQRTCPPLARRQFLWLQTRATRLNFINRSLFEKDYVLPTSSQSSEAEDIFLELFNMSGKREKLPARRIPQLRHAIHFHSSESVP